MSVNKPEEESLKYTCINCGNHVKELYRVYSPAVLKLSNCNHCHLVVDKYIEYDPVIIIIDLVLLNREAYRHILFNTKCSFHWKLLVIILLMEAYWEMSWQSKIQAQFDGSNQESNGNDMKPIVLDKFYTGDSDYYHSLFQVVCRNIFFFLVIFFFSMLRIRLSEGTFEKIGGYSSLLDDVMKCTTLSSFGIFLFLPSLIWEKHGTEDYHYIFVIVYTTLSQLVAYTVFCKCSKFWSIMVILCAYGVKIKTSSILNLKF